MLFYVLQMYTWTKVTFLSKIYYDISFQNLKIKWC